MIKNYDYGMVEKKQNNAFEFMLFNVKVTGKADQRQWTLGNEFIW